MPRRIAVNTLNASTMDILNTIRANCTPEYINNVPEVTKATDIPKVGEVLYGYPALANQFISSLVNRIAMVRAKSALFNNKYAKFKKGYLEFGEVVEECFVQMAKAREFSAEKAADRELKRTLPDVRTALHAMNYKVQYPITIQENDLRMAFTSADGVKDLIAKILNSLMVAAEYDEYLLFKYVIIKAVSHGKVYPVAVDGSDMNNYAEAFRGMSNNITFMKKEYNDAGVTTITEKADQYIFMDSMFNAKFDVRVLAAAFNMDKAEFMGKLELIDDFTTFDNDRFSVIRENSDMLEEVTEEELAIMQNVKAILVDSEWFQFYDNNFKVTEDYVAAGDYWNYFLNVWKTVSTSPFSNIIVFVDDSAAHAAPASIKATITDKSTSDYATVLTIVVDDDTPSLTGGSVTFLQDETSTEAGIAIHKYGAIIFPADGGSVTLKATANGAFYTSGAAVANTANVGDAITLNKDA